MRKNDLDYVEPKEEQKKEGKRKLPARAYIGITISAIGLLMFLSNFFLGSLFMNGSGGLGMISALAIGGMVLIVIGLLMGGYMLFFRMGANMQKNILETHKDTLTDLSNTGAEIKKGAVGTYAKTIKEVWNENEDSTNAENNKDANKTGVKTKYCKHCGKKIDADSNFCNHCGGEQ